jgi:hypothetical protein
VEHVWDVSPSLDGGDESEGGPSDFVMIACDTDDRDVGSGRIIFD